MNSWTHRQYGSPHSAPCTYASCFGHTNPKILVTYVTWRAEDWGLTCCGVLLPSFKVIVARWQRAHSFRLVIINNDMAYVLSQHWLAWWPCLRLLNPKWIPWWQLTPINFLQILASFIFRYTWWSSVHFYSRFWAFDFWLHKNSHFMHNVISLTFMYLFFGSATSHIGKYA